jgi:thiosulfate/3-mercaptopyruvate sulfurtransferase
MIASARMVKTVAGIVLAGVFFCSNAYAFGENKFEKEVKVEHSAVKLVREVVKGEYKTITAAELHDLIAAKKDILIVDTMPYEASYRKAHIPGAKQFLFPISEMLTWDSTKTGGKTVEDYQTLLGPDKNRQIIVYCGFVKCTRSHNGALWAKKLGYTNVYRQPGGIFAWKGEGYATEEAK